MFSRTTIAFSLAAMLASASAAVAAPTQRHVVHQQPSGNNGISTHERMNSQAGPFYYEPSNSGTVWSYYPGYTPMLSDSQHEHY